MKKISNLELSSIVISLIVSVNSGINRGLLLNNTGINSWITLILAFVIGFINVFFILYIANYLDELSILDKLKVLFKGYYKIIIWILWIIYFIICFTLLYFISSFVTSQFLYRTPVYICFSILIFLILHCVNKGINTITRVNLMLSILSILLFIITVSSLIEHFDFSNLMPILVNDNQKILPCALIIASNITAPLFILLYIPKKKLTHPEKYNKTIILSYILGAIISIVIVVITLGVLGIYLTKIASYPEYIVLKKGTLFGFLERIENVVANQWTLWLFGYLSLIIKYLGDNISLDNNYNKYVNMGICLLVILCNLLLFKSSTFFNNYVSQIFPYIVLCLEPIYLIIVLMIFINMRRRKYVNNLN